MPNPVRWVLARALLSLAVALTLAACGGNGEEEVEAPTRPATHATAHAEAERAAGLSPGLLGDIRDVHVVFLRCSNQMSVLSSPVEQRRCYGWGAAVTTYLNMRPDYEYHGNMQPVVHQRMEALGWLNEGEPAFRPIGVGQ